MKYLLDTNICIYTIKKKPGSVIEAVKTKSREAIAISTVTIAELEYGVARSSFPDRNRAALFEFLIPFSILDFDQVAAYYYGQLRGFLERRATPIGPMDLLLAAQARSRNLILVTNNEKEFRRVEGLRIENWVAA